MIIDSQIHAYEANTPKRPWLTKPNWPASASGDEMVAEFDRLGIDGAIFISSFSMFGYDASYAVEVQKAHPGRFALVKPVDPDRPDIEDVIADWKKHRARWASALAAEPWADLHKVLALAKRSNLSG